MRFLFFIAVWFTLGLTCSCVSTQRAISVLKKSSKLAAVCANEFPVRDSIIYHEYKKIDTIFFISDSVRFRDTLVCGRDTVVRSKEFIYPTSKVVVHTIFKDSLVYRENTAKIQDLQDKLDKETAKAQDTQKSLQTWRWRAIIFMVITLFLFLIVLKSIFKWI